MTTKVEFEPQTLATAGTPSVLVVDDTSAIRTLLAFSLDRLGYRVNAVSTGEDALELIANDPPDVLLLDLMLPGMNGLDVMRTLRSLANEIPIVVLTAHGTIEVAVEAMKLGARDFITKPFEIERLSIAVSNAIEVKRLRSEVRSLREELHLRKRFESIIGHDAGLRATVEMAKKVVPSNLTVLLQGESGTGKDVFAGVLHHEGPRKNGPFVALNCAALPAGLLESELFGHERGAFTGAERMHRGKLELADGGTLFLDEIGELPIDLQAKLLRAIQERAITRVGGQRTIRVDVRFIAASNRDLLQACGEGTFRQDLYYRIAEFPLTIPPLRDRRCDVPALAMAALTEAGAAGKVVIDPEAMGAMERYAWPGNVRELNNAVRRALLLTTHGTISLEHLPPQIQDVKPLVPAEYHGDVAHHLCAAIDEVAGIPSLEAIERALIERTVVLMEGNLSLAARALGIGRTTLYRKMHDYGIHRER